MLLLQAQLDPEDCPADGCGFALLSTDELETAWSAADSFIRSQVIAPLESTGWEVSGASSTPARLVLKKVLAEQDRGNGGTISLCIPRTLAELLDERNMLFWKDQFLWKGFLTVVRRDPDNELSLSVQPASATPSIDNLVYLIQLFAPGFITLTSLDDNERRVKRLLPEKSWVDAHYSELIEIFGKTFMHEACAAIEDAERSHEVSAPPATDEAKNWTVADEDEDDEWWMRDEYDDWERRYPGPMITRINGRGEMILDYESDTSFGKDYTACDKECGYCGRCDY